MSKITPANLADPTFKNSLFFAKVVDGWNRTVLNPPSKDAADAIFLRACDAMKVAVQERLLVMDKDGTQAWDDSLSKLNKPHLVQDFLVKRGRQPSGAPQLATSQRAGKASQSPQSPPSQSHTPEPKVNSKMRQLMPGTSSGPKVPTAAPAAATPVASDIAGSAVSKTIPSGRSTSDQGEAGNIQWSTHRQAAPWARSKELGELRSLYLLMAEGKLDKKGEARMKELRESFAKQATGQK